MNENSDGSGQNMFLGAFQQYLRNQNLFCIWDSKQETTMHPTFSNNNYHPKQYDREPGFSLISAWATGSLHRETLGLNPSNGSQILGRSFR